MEWLVLPLLALAPGVFWIWFFIRRDRYRPEPKKWILLTFVFGAISTIPAFIINEVILGISQHDPASFHLMPVGVVFFAALNEETVKFLAVRLGVFRTRHFDEPSDGLVYAVAACIGFAYVENLLYIIEYGPDVILGRSILSMAGHVIFGSVWGFALGRAKGSKLWRTAGLVGGVTAASIVHAVYNLAAFSAELNPFALLGVVTIVAIGIWWIFRTFDWANRSSPFRFRRNYPQIHCPRLRQPDQRDK